MIERKAQMRAVDLRQAISELKAHIAESRLMLQEQNRDHEHISGDLQESRQELTEQKDHFIAREQKLEIQRNQLLGLMKTLNETCESTLKKARSLSPTDEL